MRRVTEIALAVSVAVAAARAILWLLERDGAEAAPEPPQQPPARAEAQNGVAPGGASGAGEPTRDQLYREARRLEIQGRSKMNKQELQRAIEATETKGTA